MLGIFLLLLFLFIFLVIVTIISQLNEEKQILRNRLRFEKEALWAESDYKYKRNHIRLTKISVFSILLVFVLVIISV